MPSSPQWAFDRFRVGIRITPVCGMALRSSRCHPKPLICCTIL